MTVYACVCMCTKPYGNAFIHAHQIPSSIHICTYMRTHTRTHTNTHEHTRMNVCTLACIPVCLDLPLESVGELLHVLLLPVYEDDVVRSHGLDELEVAYMHTHHIVERLRRI